MTGLIGEDWHELAIWATLTLGIWHHWCAKAVMFASCCPSTSISLQSERTSLLVFPGTHDNRAIHAGDGTGGGRSSAIIRRRPAKCCFGIAASSIWKARYQHWLTTFTPILMSFYLRLISDQTLIGSGIARVRRKLSKLKPTAAPGPERRLHELRGWSAVRA